MVPAVDIVGYGRLGRALHQLFIEKAVPVRCIYSQSQTGEGFAPRESWLTDSSMSPMVFLAIPDDQIEPQLAMRQASDSLFIQCSGNCNLVMSDTLKTAVWYPLQSFSQGRTLQWEEIPVLIESNSTDLQVWSRGLGLRVQMMSGMQRRALHLAAVWANNFGQTVVGAAAEICRNHQIDPEILQPLLDETLNKALTLTGEQAQTGPARRGDDQTQQDHLELMKDDDSMKELYQQLSLFIRQRYGRV
jgi:hypothetical protein